MKIKQFFAPYTQWEDWKLGMYRNAKSSQEHERMVAESVALLKSKDVLQAMRKACESMPVSAKVNLTNADANHRPWLGQSACLLSCGANEVAVREAWSKLSLSEQAFANDCADRVFNDFLRANQIQPMLPGLEVCFA
jgi:prophage antirepressor-like protein